MAEQLLNENFGNIFPSSQFSLVKILLLSTFYLPLKPQIMKSNPPNRKVLNSKYDFIIVGAGSAGAVIASRLSENPDFQVLVLEAGGDETGISNTPALYNQLQQTPKDWNYTIAPSTAFCLGMIDKTCSYPRGKILGGTSSINGMIYTRGNKKDYDGWASAGNYGWSFEEVLPYFKKSEDFTIPFTNNERYHSLNGELTVSNVSFSTPLGDIFGRAAEELGYFRGDFNAAEQTVSSYPQVTIRDGSRCSTNKAFLLPAGERENLHVAKYAHVTKVLVDPITKRAYGVRYFRCGAYHDVLARKEIILSAGVINSPQLLMLSGIGPKKHLKKFNIPVIKNLPVGFNLQDHSGFQLPFVTDKPVTFRIERYFNNETNMIYDFNQTGPLTSVFNEGIVFVNSKFQDPKESHPDLQISLIPINAAAGGTLGNNLARLSNELWEAIFVPLINKETFSIIVALLRPKSKGRIQLKNKDPFAKPVINVNYFDEKDDVRRLIDGARFALKLMEAKAFKEINSRYPYAPLPLCPDVLPLSDEYFECYMRYFTQPFNHAVGTAKMGPQNDTTSVVDPELRVHGISCLRVADASIMPTVASGNTNAPTIMIGEKASDLIKNSWAIETNA